MSRLGIVDGKKVLFTHHNPMTGEYWTDELRPNSRSPYGMWVDSKQINFNLEPKKRKSRFHRKER